MTALNASELVARAHQVRAQLLSPGAPFELEMVEHQGQ